MGLLVSCSADGVMETTVVGNESVAVGVPLAPPAFSYSGMPLVIDNQTPFTIDFKVYAYAWDAINNQVDTATILASRDITGFPGNNTTVTYFDFRNSDNSTYDFTTWYLGATTYTNLSLVNSNFAEYNTTLYGPPAGPYNYGVYWQAMRVTVPAQYLPALSLSTPSDQYYNVQLPNGVGYSPVGNGGTLYYSPGGPSSLHIDAEFDMYGRTVVTLTL